MLVIFFILKFLLFIFLAFITLFVLFLTLPITYSGEVILVEGFKAKCQFGWPWKFFNIKGSYNEQRLEMGIYMGRLRLVKLKLDNLETKQVVAKEKPKKKKKEEKKDKKEDNKEKKESKQFGNIFDKALFKELMAYLKKVLGILRPKYLHLKGAYGFEDPAITGMVCGAVNIVHTIVPNANIDMYPDFADEVFEIDVKAEGRMVIGSLIYQTARTFLKKDIRKKLFQKR